MPVTDHTETAARDRTISLHRFRACVFDLDGVITRTAEVHAAAWKETFDDFLARRSGDGMEYAPFDLRADYLEYVDGKPRYDGVRSFLDSRGIELPPGDPGDDPGQETICGLGNRKNELFRKILRSDGVRVYDSSVELIRKCRRAGVHVAVVSSSRNCRAVLEAAGIEDLFDARVDGTDLQRLGLAGKPAPDMFLEASRRLGVEPQRTVGVEDAVSGVAAARAAGDGLVIGVNRGDQAGALAAHGADTVVDDLAEIKLSADGGAGTAPLPSALEQLDRICTDGKRKPALFLDYDGSLTPIVPHPDDAVMSDSMRATLKRLSRLCRVAVISGRDLTDVRERVGIEDIWYAGSHGFDLGGPGDQHREYRHGREFLPSLAAAEQTLREKLAHIPGCEVERKRFAVTVHYRRVAEQGVAEVRRIVDGVHAAHPELRLTTGKKILELLPDIDWDKGRALRWLMDILGMTTEEYLPIYIGDDVTDEDAFRELADDGVGILVTRTPQPTRAKFRLADVDSVETFLRRLGDLLEGERQ